MTNIFEKETYSQLNAINEDEELNNYDAILLKSNNKKYSLRKKNNALRNISFKYYFLNNFSFFKCFLIFLILFAIFGILIGSILKIHLKTIDNFYTILQNSLNSKSNKNVNFDNTIKDYNKHKNIITQSTNKIQSENEINKEEEEKDVEEEEFEPKKEDIYKEEKYDSIELAFNKAKDFLDKSMKGILLHTTTSFKSSEKPKLSVVIPLYNSKDYISRAIKSIQNQNILDLEIVLVNDYSTDDTLKVVENIQKTDPRIKIIKNKKNMGIIYSRSIGALNAKGKYIFPLDNDDMFLDKDAFEEITKVADKGNFDLVEFKGVFSRTGGYNLLTNQIQDTYFSGHKLNLVMFQPELGNYPIRPSKEMGKFDIMDNFLWVKCIKTKIYQKALNKLGEERYSRHMIMHEDLLVIYILFNIAKSYKYIGKYGIFHIQRPGSASWKYFSDSQMNIYNLYLTDVIIDFSQENKENKKLVVYIITFMIDRPQLEKTLENDYNKKLFISCLDRALNSNFISEEDKNIIKEKGKKLTFLNYHFE